MHIIDFGAEFGEHRVVTLAREFGIGPRAGIFDRAPDDDAAWSVVERPARVSDQALEEQAAPILQTERPAPDHRALAPRARRAALDRLAQIGRAPCRENE